VRPEVRRAIAFVVARSTDQSRRSAVYEYDLGSHTIFSGQVGSHISIYDHGAGAHIQGPLNQFYHYGARCHIQLNITGSQFRGYDFGTGSHFSGTVRRQNVQLYDFEDGKYHQYHVS